MTILKCFTYRKPVLNQYHILNQRTRLPYKSLKASLYDNLGISINFVYIFIINSIYVCLFVCVCVCLFVRFVLKYQGNRKLLKMLYISLSAVFIKKVNNFNKT